jgi:hypothetical protein
MKLFYICDKEETAHIPTGFHALDLGNEKLLVCIHWTNEAHEAAWASRPGVICLPHPIFEATQPLTAEHVQHLSGRYQIIAGNNIHDMIKQAAKEDLWMRLRVL